MNPLSAIYAAGTGFRNHLYDRGVLASHRLRIPVISVGSVSAGGAGKTPFVILLGEALQKRDIKFDVLSRGYGRKTRGAQVVNASGSAAEFGDEPLLIARRLACPVVVGESRFEAGTLAEKECASELHILDDGFQHRSLARDFDIALLTAADLTDDLLPFGRLREPLPSLRRADVIVLSGDAQVDQVRFAGQKIWRVRRHLQITDVPDNPVVFCGIARPNNFLDQVKKAGIRPATFRVFGDHHSYSPEDVRALVALREDHHAGGFVTTEKDVINLESAIAQLGTVAVARVVMEIIDPADAVDAMLAFMSERKRQA